MKVYSCAVLVIMLQLSAPTTQAVTWDVEKDGSGDYTVIQDAIDAAASGDTVRIGPGRFEDFLPHTSPGGDYLIIAMVEVDDLTIIGSGVDQTILGPEAYGEPYPDPHPIAINYWSNTSAGMMLVEQLRIENVRTGIYGVNSGARMVIRDCDIVGGTRGVNTSITCEMLNCDISNTYLQGLMAYAPTDSVIVVDCSFTDIRDIGLQFQAPFADVRNCLFRSTIGGQGGGVFFEGGGGGVYDSVFEDLIYCIYLSSPQLPVIQGNSMTASYACIYSSDAEAFIAEGNILQGGTGPAISLRARGLPHTIRGNHILKGTGLAVELTGDYWAPDDYRLDLTDNWWGTTDTDSISAWIHDASDPDMPPLKVFIDFEPFLPGPVPAEKQSLGGLKALFR